MALPLALSMIAVLMILMGGTSMMVMNSQQQASSQFSREAQASNVARAGLKAGIGWFKIQDHQPVKQNASIDEHLCEDDPSDPNGRHLAFFPREDQDNPNAADTIDESIGLVREFKVQGNNIYGRYIVKRYRCDEAPNSDWNRHAVKDVTFERGKNDGEGTIGQGAVWQINAEGLVYIKNDPDKEPDEAPNRILARSSASQEINRISLSVPKAPLSLTAPNATGANQSVFNNKCEVIGDFEAISAIVLNEPTANISGTPNYTGSTTIHRINTGLGEENKTVENTFNMNLEELKSAANAIYINESEISTIEPLKFGITYLDGNGTKTFAFNTARPLRGSGVLFVHGHLDLQADSNSSFSGLVYVTGNLTITASNQIGGAVVANKVTCQPGNSAILEYNDSIMKSVRQRLGLYSESNLSLNTQYR